MKNFKLLLLLLVPFFFLTLSCQDEELTMEVQFEDTADNSAVVLDDGSELKMDAALKDIIGTFSSVVLNNPDLIDIIRNESLKKFDGDFDVLFETVRDVQVTDAKSGKSGTFMDHLVNYTDAKSGEPTVKDLEAKIADIMDFNIYFHNPEVKSDKILMLAVPYDIDDMDQTEYVAYDKYGKEYRLDVETPPDFPVICLGMNERVGMEEYMVKPEDIEEMADKGYYNHSHILKKFITSNDLEHWGQGGADIYAMYAIGFESYFSCKQFYLQNVDENKWYHFNMSIWDCPSLPQFGWARVEFWEKDGNQKVTWGIQGDITLFPGTKIPIKASFQLDNIGMIRDDLFGGNVIFLEEGPEEATGFGSLTAQYDWQGSPIYWTLWGVPFFNDAVYGEWGGWRWDDGVAAGSFDDYYNDPDASDNTDPSMPGNLKVEDIHWYGGTMTWAASSDDYGISKYDIYLDDEPIGETRNLYFVLNHLKAGVYHTVSVIARDLAGNHSQPAQINFRTLDY